MASIGSRDLQENIVGPLMDMMTQLSTEMRKNLAHEVSSIGRKVDELSGKVDYLINAVVNNNGNNTLVCGTPVLRTRTLPPTYRRNNENHHSKINGNHNAQDDKSHVIDDDDDDDEIVSGQIGEQKEETLIEKIDFKTRKNRALTDLKTTNDTSDKTVRKEDKESESLDDTQSFNKSSEKHEPMNYLNTNGYTNGIAKEAKSKPFEVEGSASESYIDEEITPQSDIVIKPVPNSRDQASIGKGHTIVNTEVEPVPIHVNECFKIGDNSMKVSPPTHRPFNFGMEKSPKRPKSPIPTSATKIEVPYANFKKSRTEFSCDNRATYLKDAFNIMENSADTDRCLNMKPDSTIDEKIVQSQELIKPARGDKNTLKTLKNDAVVSRSKDNDDAAASNNHQLPPSGFYNEHGDDDNRFNAAAHEDMLPYPIGRRTSELSNLKRVKTGPRNPVSGDDVIHGKGGEEKNREEPAKSGPELVSDEVLYSLIEKERLSATECKDMKSTGIDTVICLDTSSSMTGKSLKTAIDCIEKILDGFETNAVYHNLEENVALVTFGNENRIYQHLTNDYGLIKEGLETIKAGGPSPLWLGLALSLAELKERGGACIMEPMSVLPRIILITDGYASRKNILLGDDNDELDDQAIREMMSLMKTCPSFTSCLECIKPGKCHEEFLTGLTNGRMYTANNTESITDFFKIQEKANDIIKQVQSAEMDRAKVDEAIENSCFNDKGKEDLRQIVLGSLPPIDQQPSKPSIHERGKDDPAQTSIEKTNPAEPQEDTSMSQVSLDWSDDVKSPAFGTAVQSNHEWDGFATRQNLTGTVVGPRKKGSLKVLWSDGTIERCKFGVNGLYEIIVSEDQSIDNNQLKIGSIVVRGKDWRWKDQDGGEGNIGVVTKIEGPVVHVIWSHGGLGNYRYGYNKKFDLTLCKSRGVSHFAWYIEEEDDQWKRLPKIVTESIEQMYQSKHTGTFLVKMDTQSLRISLQNLQARDVNSQKAYNLERKEISEEEWLAISNEQ